MPTHELEQIFIRIGLALVAGAIIAVVPIARRMARFEHRTVRRVLFNALSLLALTAFCIYMVFLWNRYVPARPEPPPPVSYPIAPALPSSPANP